MNISKYHLYGYPAHTAIVQCNGTVPGEYRQTDWPPSDSCADFPERMDSVRRERVFDGLEAGMNDHLGKPIDPDTLKKTLLRYLR